MSVDWNVIHTQEALDALNSRFCWDDVVTIQYYVNNEDGPRFLGPYAGFGSSKTARVWIETSEEPGSYVEFVFLGGQVFGDILGCLLFNGHVDSLRRVYIYYDNGSDSVALRCSTMAYQVVANIPEIGVVPISE